jgi:toxin ParE1/3/4
MNLRWTPTAIRDLESLHSFISSDSAQAAARMVETIVVGIETLRQHPQMGRKGRALRTRELVVSPYVVAYDVKDNVIRVLAIIHSARQWPESL